MYPQRRRRVRQALGLGLLVALVVLAMSACGEGSSEGGGEENKSETGGSAATNGQIAFRRWFDPDQTKGALFTMNPDGSHVRQITHPPRARTTTPRCGLPMGRRSPSLAARPVMGAGSWSSTSTRAIRVRSRTADPMGDGPRSTRLHHLVIIAWETPNLPSHPTVSQSPSVASSALRMRVP